MAIEQVTKNLGATKDAEGKEVVGKTVTVNFDFGNDLAAGIKLFGEPAVFSAYHRAAVISLQSFLASCLKQGMSTEESQKAVDSWKLGVGGTGAVITESTMLNAFSKMTLEEQKAHVAKIQAMLAGIKK